jgi:large subunit ribosomal protein LX
MDWFSISFLHTGVKKLSSQVKKFRISGILRKGGDKLPFRKEFAALKKEDALQHLYTDMGSRHKARRFEISIDNIEEVTNNQQEEAVAE